MSDIYLHRHILESARNSLDILYETETERPKTESGEEERAF